MAALFDIRLLVKDYQGLRPLRVRELSVSPGRVLSLAGFDAAAAEIFVHLVTGAALPDEGDISLFGTNTRHIQDAEAWLHSLDGLGLVRRHVRRRGGCTAGWSGPVPAVEQDPQRSREQ